MQEATRKNPKIRRKRFFSLTLATGDLSALANFCVTRGCTSSRSPFFQKAIEVNPNSGRLFRLGINLLRLATSATAKKMLEKAYQKDPFNLWTVNSLRLVESYEHLTV